MPKKVKKILTVEDLIQFCQEQNFSKFSSKETGYQLAVKVPTTFEVVESVDDNHRGMTKLKFRIFHTGLNRNMSYVSKEAATKAMNTIADRPVLAAIHQLDDGTWDFEGHEMEIVTDENGNEELRYIESQVGSFSSEPAFWEHDDELDKDYVCAYAYIADEYTKTSEIIKQKNGTKNSCELFVDELSYNGKEKYLDLIDFYVNASTLLGSRADGTPIQEGMQGSRADIADFSAKNNSVKFNKDEKIIELLEKLNNMLSDLNTYNSKKGGETKNMTFFEKLLKKYNKTIEDIMFEYKDLSDDELIAKFAEIFDETDDSSEARDSGETGSETSTDDTTDEEIGEEDTSASDTSDTFRTTTDNAEDPIKKKKVKNSVKYTYIVGKETKTFSVSLQEKIYAIQDLVNATYAEADNTYYGVIVYENYVVMCDYWSGRYYKQSYSSEKDNYSLTGDRVEVYAEFVTADEQATLDDMRSNYAELREFKETAEKNELHAQKEEIINSDKYAVIAKKNEDGEYINESFAKLVSKMDNYSLTELKTQIKVIHSDYVAEHSNFSTKIDAEPSVKMKQFTNPAKNTKKSRYGSLFSK